MVKFAVWSTSVAICLRPFSSYEQKIKALYQVPEHLEVKKKEQSEEMLSNQMLSGIPEVDLGLE